MSWLSHSTFFFYSSDAHRDLHSFPTRRSSDLMVPHAAKVGVRAASTAFTAGFANPIISFLEDLADRKSTRELQSRRDLVCRLLLEKKKKEDYSYIRQHSM